MSLARRHLLPPFRPDRYRTLSAFTVALAICMTAGLQAGDTTQDPVPAEEPPAGNIPAPLNPEEDFGTLSSNSPFLRSLNLSDSLTLTGIAHIGSEPMIVVRDRESKETQVISGTANPGGLQLVGIEGSQTDLKSMTAQIRSSGGEIFAVRFDEDQLKPDEQRGPSNRGRSFGNDNRSRYRSDPRDYRNGISGDGFRGPPPRELVEKLSRMDERRRNEIIRQMAELRERGVSSEERQQIFTRMVERGSR